jgi:serine-type D-Ala-D-Ala carboxypeptidase/endopeptidase (penicillin-binding protein 4)
MTRILLRPIAFASLLLGLGGCASILPGAIAGPSTTPLAGALDAIFDDPVLAHAHWGVLVRSLDTGETLYSRNADRMFLPASNVKLFTGAASLEALGPEFRSTTTFAPGGAIRAGVLQGPLVVVGSGDPTISGRFHPNPRDAFRAWADSLRAHGITRIAGGIVAVDTAFTDPPLGAGWAWDDLAFGYSAAFGPLQFNEGVITLEVFPASRVMDPAIVVLDPATQYVRIVNDVRTAPAGSRTSIRIEREEAGSGIVLVGDIAADDPGVERVVAVRDPALYFVSVLRETLREAGIPVEGPAFRHTELGPFESVLGVGIPIFTYSSPPMREIVPAMMKPSQNLIAETMLRTVGREVRGQGSASAGSAVVDSLLASWEIDTTGLRMVDGSGLSRYNLLSPAITIALLERMSRSYYRDDWVASLPVAGVDGTLSSRMRDAPLYQRVQAKTGTLGGARALSGYLTTVRGERIAFSMISNHHVVPSAQVDRVVESALERIATMR